MPTFFTGVGIPNVTDSKPITNYKNTKQFTRVFYGYICFGIEKTHI